MQKTNDLLHVFFNLSACVCSICTLRNCVDFIQVLQLSFSAPLIADFPVGDKHDSMTLLKVLSNDCRLGQGWSSTAQLITFYPLAHGERTESQHEALSNSNLCVSMYFWCSSVLRALCCLPQILLRLNKLLMSCAEYEAYELGLNAFRKCTSRKDEAEAKTLISPKNHCKTEM